MKVLIWSEHQCGRCYPQITSTGHNEVLDRDVLVSRIGTVAQCIGYFPSLIASHFIITERHYVGC